MLTGRREQALLLVGLAAVNALLGWQWHHHWQAFKSRTQWVYAMPAPEPAAAAAVPSAATAAQSFAEIVERNLFHPDRTSAGPQEETGAAEPPALYGTMNLGARWFALMAPAEQAATGVFKRVYPGEEIGGYKLVDIRGAEVVVERGERRLTLDVATSSRRVVRSAEPPAAPRPAAAPARAVPQRGPVTTTAPAAPPARTGSDERSRHGPAGYNAPPGAPVDAPAGAVFGGRRKVVRRTPFGDQVWWEEIEKPKPQDEKQNEKKEN